MATTTMNPKLFTVAGLNGKLGKRIGLTNLTQGTAAAAAASSSSSLPCAH